MSENAASYEESKTAALAKYQEAEADRKRAFMADPVKVAAWRAKKNLERKTTGISYRDEQEADRSGMSIAEYQADRDAVLQRYADKQAEKRTSPEGIAAHEAWLADTDAVEKWKQEKNASKTPAQREAELEAWRARQESVEPDVESDAFRLTQLGILPSSLVASEPVATQVEPWVEGSFLDGDGNVRNLNAPRDRESRANDAPF